MNGHNAQFQADPNRYTNAWIINSVQWFRNAQHGVNAQRNTLLGILKEGYFDFVPAGGINSVTLTVIGNQNIGGEQPVSAYWCPFVQGNILPGYIDLPRQNPDFRFVFTAAMQGCALVATESPQGPNFFRLYHHQHPDSNNIWTLIHNQNQEVLSILSYADYGQANVANGVGNSFNFLYYRNSNWVYITQPQILSPDLTVRLNANKQKEIISVLP